MSREIKNARITSTMLGIEDHGILTFFLTLAYGDTSAQGFGGWTLDGSPATFASRLLTRLLEVVGVRKWEDLPGAHIRADASWDKVHRIGNVLEDEWLDPMALAQSVEWLETRMAQ